MPFFVINNQNAPADPDSYLQVEKPPECGRRGKQVCYIETEADPITAKPIIDMDLLGEILSALNRSRSTARVKLKPLIAKEKGSHKSGFWDFLRSNR